MRNRWQKHSILPLLAGRREFRMNNLPSSTQSHPIWDPVAFMLAAITSVPLCAFSGVSAKIKNEKKNRQNVFHFGSSFMTQNVVYLSNGKTISIGLKRDKHEFRLRRITMTTITNETWSRLNKTELVLLYFSILNIVILVLRRTQPAMLISFKRSLIAKKKKSMLTEWKRVDKWKRLFAN